MQWGPWSMDQEHLQLVHKASGYEVSFRGRTSSAALLDCIFQIRDKTWADADTLTGLLAAFEDVLHPQENYCSGGVDKQADGGALARRYIENPNERENLLEALRRTLGP